MSRYDRPVDYGDPDHEAEADAHNAVNFLGDYAPKGLNDVGEVTPQPEPSSPAWAHYTQQEMEEWWAENRRKQAAFRNEIPADLKAWAEEMEDKWRPRRLEDGV